MNNCNKVSFNMHPISKYWKYKAFKYRYLAVFMISFLKVQENILEIFYNWDEWAQKICSVKFPSREKFDTTSRSLLATNLSRNKWQKTRWRSKVTYKNTVTFLWSTCHSCKMQHNIYLSVSTHKQRRRLSRKLMSSIHIRIKTGIQIEYKVLLCFLSYLKCRGKQLHWNTKLKVKWNSKIENHIS